MKSCVLLMLLALGPIATAEHVVPELRVGSSWEYSYRSTVIYDDGKFGMTNITEGRMVQRLTGKDVVNGVEYFKGRVEYIDIFGIPPQDIWVRADDQGYYTAMDLRGTFVEACALALPPTPGRRWDFFDGEEGWRTIAGRELVEAEGQRYENCIKVERGFKDPEKAQMFTQAEWYAPGKGAVRFHFVQKRGPTFSKVETMLLNYTPGPP